MVAGIRIFNGFCVMQNLPLDSLTYSLWIFEGESKTMGEGLLSYDCMQPKIDLKRKRE